MGTADTGGHAFEAGAVMAPIAQLLLSQMAHFMGRNGGPRRRDTGAWRCARDEVFQGLENHAPHTQRENGKTNATIRPGVKPVLGSKIL